MEENYSIIHFKEHHLNQVKKLYEESYNRKKPVNYFRYRYLSSPFGKPIVLLMKYKKKIIGLYAIHPVKLQIEDKSVLGGYSFLTMTHPDHVGGSSHHDRALRPVWRLRDILSGWVEPKRRRESRLI